MSAPDIEVANRDDRAEGSAALALTPAQQRHFATFGFVVLRGLFADDVATLTAGFDEVFASEEVQEYRHALHFDQLRQVVAPGFLDRSDKLSWLRDDPRLVGIVTSLIGERYDYNESDGNLFSCDTGWHSDVYGATMDRLHIKLYFYLDPLRADTGALRMMPGTNSSGTPYADTVRRDLWNVTGPQDAYGIDPRDIPCSILETDPGDVIVGDYRTLHATFGGAPRRRLFTINFSEPPEDAEAAAEAVAAALEQVPWKAAGETS